MTARTPAQRVLRLAGMLSLGGALLLVAAVLWHNWGDLWWPEATTPQVAHNSKPSADTLSRGEYLVRAGNCVACHTARGGTPMAGARAIDTPFGAVYSSNLTPDNDTGLGRWSTQDFWNALHHGRSRGGRLLAPAFPYEHTSLLSREDTDAMFAWLRSQPAISQPQPAHTLRWPLGTQPALALWRTLFFEPRPWRDEPGRSAEWNRGAYLVLGLGHCAACHAPRNGLGASAGIDALSGGTMPSLGWYAPNLLSARETGLATRPLADTVRLLQTGQSPQASTSGPMAEVVQHSLQYLSPADLQAMAVYLRTRAQEAAPEPPPVPAPPVRASVRELGLKVYERHCATCHGEQGEGATGIYPALRGNRAVLLSEPTNLVQTLLFGGFGPSTAGHPRPFGMPPFVLELDDREIAAVLTHLRMALQPEGSKAGEVTPLQVNRIRAESTQ